MQLQLHTVATIPLYTANDTDASCVQPGHRHHAHFTSRADPQQLYQPCMTQNQVRCTPWKLPHRTEAPPGSGRYRQLQSVLLAAPVPTAYNQATETTQQYQPPPPQTLIINTCNPGHQQPLSAERVQASHGSSTHPHQLACSLAGVCLEITATSKHSSLALLLCLLVAVISHSQQLACTGCPSCALSSAALRLRLRVWSCLTLLACVCRC